MQPTHSASGKWMVRLGLFGISLLGIIMLTAMPARTQSGVPRPNHVVIVMEENHSYSEIIGSSAAPYINSLAQQGASFTDSHGVTHPSQPNYLAFFSGSTQGVTDDNCGYTFGGPDLGSELIAAGLAFGGYSEDQPSVGYAGCSSGNYVRKHNPWVDFTDLPTSVNMPFTSFPTDYSALPTVSIVVPNLQDDMHDGTIQQANSWLQQHLDSYLQWAKTNNSLLIVTWDEDDGSTTNQIPTIFAGPMVKAGHYSETINHYNVLRTIEQMYGLPNMNNTAAAAPITDCWGTSSTSQPPAAPANLTASAGSGEVTLSWTGSAGATSYNVYRSTASGQEGSVPYATGIAGAGYIDNGVTNGTTYYQVTAVNSVGESARSGEASATPQAAAASASLPPLADAYVRDGSYADTNFGWTDTLYVKTNATTGVNRDTYFKFDLSSVGGISSAVLRFNGSLSETGSVSTTAYGISDNSWTENGITWNNRPPLGNALGSTAITNSTDTWYQIDVTSYIQAQKAGGHNTVSLALHNVPTSYQYVQIHSKEYSPSLAAQLVIGSASTSQPPAAPANLTASAGSGEVTLSWTGSAGATSYNVYRSTASGQEGSVPYATGIAGAGYIDNGVTNGTTYYYQVTAVNSVGESARSGEASATPQAAAASASLPPLADAYVRDGSYADTNFGSTDTLYVKTNATTGLNRDTYFKFDLSSVGGISSAVLRFNGSLSETGSVSTTAYGISDNSWTESGITWNNRPPLGSALGSVTISGSTFAWYQIDLTRYVQAQKAAGRSTVSVALHNVPLTYQYVQIRSKEYSPSLAAQLKIN